MPVPQLFSRYSVKPSFYAVILALMAGCGGGGGGDGSKTPHSSAITPLKIYSANAYDVVSSGVAFSEMIFEYGETALEVIDAASRQNNFPVYSDCVSGSVVDDFIDHDSNHTVSAGDVITSTYNNCYDPAFGGALSGTITLTLTAPSASAFTTKWSGTIEFSNFEIVMHEDPSVPLNLSGGILFNFYGDLVSSTLEVSTATGGFRVGARSASRAVEETIIVNLGRKALRYDEARYSLQVNGEIQSEILGGSFTVSNTTPISGQLGSLPDSGSFVFSGKENTSISAIADTEVFGGGAKLVLSPQVGGELPTSYAWTNFSDGYIWYDPLNPSVNGSVGAPLMGMVALYSSIPNTYPVATIDTSLPEIRLQFNKPVNSASLPIVQFTGQSVETTYGDIEAHGALLIIRPHAELKHAASYGIALSGEFYGLEGDGASFYHNGFSIADTLDAVVIPSNRFGFAGSNIILDASSSRSSIGSVTYEWTQVSGAPVTINNPASQSMSFTIPSLVSAPQTLTFRLKVTAPDGQTESEVVDIAAFGAQQDVDVFYYASDWGDWVGKGESKLVTAPPLMRSAVPNVDNAVSFRYSEAANPASDRYALNFAAPSQTVLQVGQYPLAIRYPFNWGRPGLDVSMNGAGCNIISGAFNVLEITYNGDGSLNTLAVDFVQHCENSTSALRGAVRINSSTPISAFPF